MLRNLAIAAAKTVPGPVRRFLHSNHTLYHASTRLFASLVGKQNVAIPAGPMQGILLAPSEHTSHAHLRGVYETETLDALARLLAPHMVCYDIGASIGYLSLLMARTARHVYAFEPAPHARAEMERHIAANGFTNIEVISTPLSGSVREVEFALTGAAYGSGIVEQNQHGWPILKLTTATLDQFLAGHHPPHFLKVDIEGEEAVLFDGATETLSRHRPIILCELHSLSAQNAVLQALAPYDYSFEDLSGQAFVPRQTVVAGEFHVVARPPASFATA
ncbi:MAG: FkbM family methyltransferase [Bryobacter sp.]|nr:FkbM family methyltransferase [Bryobacter sp.]